MGPATMDILGLSYVCSEAGIQFPRTFVLLVDNAAAQALASHSGKQLIPDGNLKGRLRHVDARWEWVQVSRDSKLAVHWSNSRRSISSWMHLDPMAQGTQQ